MLAKIKNFFKIDKSLFTIDDGLSKLNIFALTLPLFFEMIGSHLIGVVQTMMSSNFMDGFFVSPTSIVNSAISPFISIASIITVGLGIILSINLGRKRYDDCKVIIGTAFIADMVICVVFYFFVSLFAEPLIKFMGYGGAEYAQQYPYAVKFLQMKSIANIVSHLPLVFLAVLRCYGYTKIGLYTNVISNIVNAGLTAIFFYVISPAKENVLIGLVIIHVISSLVNFSLTIAYLIKKRIPISFKYNFKWFKKIFVLGLPASVAQIAYTITSTLTTRICVSLGPNPYEARIYINQLVYFVYAFGFQIGKANSIMAGRLCGMGDLDKADKMHRQNIKITVLINGSLSLMFAFFAGFILRNAYSASEAIVATAIPIFFFDVLVEIGRGMNHLGQNGLNATGDVNFTTIISITVGFVCSVGLAYVFGIWCGLGLIGIWLAFAVDELSRGSIYLIRWCRGRWKVSFRQELEKLKKTEQAT